MAHTHKDSEILSTIKNTKIASFAEKWMEMKVIMLRKIRQIQISFVHTDMGNLNQMT